MGVTFVGENRELPYCQLENGFAVESKGTFAWNEVLDYCKSSHGVGSQQKHFYTLDANVRSIGFMTFHFHFLKHPFLVCFYPYIPVTSKWFLDSNIIVIFYLITYLIKKLGSIYKSTRHVPPTMNQKNTRGHPLDEDKGLPRQM